MDQPETAAAGLAPVVTHRQGNEPERRQKRGHEDCHHRVMREMSIEARAILRLPGGKSPEEEGQRGRQKPGHGDAMGLEQPCDGLRAGQPLPAFHSDFGQSRRDVQVELMRRGVLAGIIAAPAVVAEIGQLRQVAISKGLLPGHGWKNRAEPLAVAAGVADLDLTACLVEGRCGVKRHGRRPPCPQYVRKQCQLSCQNRPDTLGQEWSRP